MITPLYKRYVVRQNGIVDHSTMNVQAVVIRLLQGGSETFPADTFQVYSLKKDGADKPHLKR
jgi:hypothetical protein